MNAELAQKIIDQNQILICCLAGLSLCIGILFGVMLNFKKRIEDLESISHVERM